MDRQILQQLNNERRDRRSVVLVTDLQAGSSELVMEADYVGYASQAPLSAVLRTGGSLKFDHPQRGALFLQAYLPPPRIVMIGAVHISQALAPMARLANLQVEIIDPRTAFATAERFAGVELYADWPEEVLGRRPLDRYCALLALTHDPKIDDGPLEAALHAGCFYVGALGSRKTHAKRLLRLEEKGLSEEQLQRIHAPIGLPIGAASPAEIAVAVLAEVIEALRSPGRGKEPA